MSPNDVDHKYYRDAASLSIAQRVSARARLNIYETFMRELAPTASTTILDIGASEHESPETNFLEKRYPFPENITCATIGNGEAFKATYPKIKWVGIEPNAPLQFPDKTFDIAYSNAVLEHVGGERERVFFLKEAIRVSKTLFIVVPNRWFPIEHHTGFPFLHYWPALFRKALAGTRFDFWTTQQNLEFLSTRLLARELRDVASATIGYAGLNLGIFSSNIVMIVK